MNKKINTNKDLLKILKERDLLTKNTNLKESLKLVKDKILKLIKEIDLLYIDKPEKLSQEICSILILPGFALKAWEFRSFEENILRSLFSEI
jgi:hypothetical protein